ncbi:MAG: FAD-dependent oxidoreductase [Flavobacteriaceae bacterium TMED238]|nr:MAG: FAD-dependent oxidoreductase [Flavobacteriaceae bacterium TMED238]|tara:strand:- start:24574 stop:25812 length:1239 start_codon:yes stop_codon:yes gene_type:complete
MKTVFDWIVIGGGIAGVSVSEILSREGKSVLLLEKNDSLASETSKEFHEWFHSGSLHTLAPDNLLTLRYLLGSADDLFQYYGNFESMNLFPTECGIKIKDNGWFNNNYILYKFKKHLWNPIWLSMVSRSTNIIDMIDSHDWLRRRAGSEYGSSKVRFKHWFSNIPNQIKSKGIFFEKESPDFTMNSRILINDLLSLGIENGLKVELNANVTSFKESVDKVTVQTTEEEYISKNIVICSPDAISNLIGTPIKTGFAPMAVVENVPANAKSFVELDYFLKKCINLLTKGDGIGQAGGITLEKQDEIKSYLDYVIKEHKKRNPEIQVIDTYVGIKKELVSSGENRNYLYHINQNSNNIWSIVLGKFTLAFSMAPEFYRRIYKKNPSNLIKHFKIDKDNNLLSKTTWQEIVNSKRS